MEPSNESFIERLARPRPDPGGGAAAAYAGSVALALAEKVVRLELSRHHEEPDEARFWGKLLDLTQSLRQEMDKLREEDVHAYAGLSRALASVNRAKELPSAFREAMGCPMTIMEKARESLTLVAEAGKRCKKHLVADLQVASELVGAVAEGAYHIGRANLYLIKNVPDSSDLEAELSKTRELCGAQFVQTRRELASRFYEERK